MPFPDLAERVSEVRERIDAAAARGGHGQVVRLVAVTKGHGPEAVEAACRVGLEDIGENRVQEALQKMANVTPQARWHLIGHLQRNKVKPVLPLVSLIHSVDSLRLAEELDTHAAKLGRRQPVLLQVNTSEEPQKYGVAVGAAVHLAEQIDSMPNLQLVGLMTMGPLGATPDQTRRVFARTREIFEEMRWHKIGGAGLRHLSMGMSNDFELAIAEGATMVRVGSLLFGGKAEDHQVMEDEG